MPTICFIIVVIIYLFQLYFVFTFKKKNYWVTYFHILLLLIVLFYAAYEIKLENEVTTNIVLQNFFTGMTTALCVEIRRVPVSYSASVMQNDMIYSFELSRNLRKCCF